MKSIALDAIAMLPIRIGQLAEQKPIVAPVEEWLRRCDTPEAQPHQTLTPCAHLLDSTLHHHLAA